MSGVRRCAGAPVERPSMTRIQFLSTCALAGLLLTAPASWAQSANDSYAWIDAPAANHALFSLSATETVVAVRNNVVFATGGAFQLASSSVGTVQASTRAGSARAGKREAVMSAV